MTVRSASRRGPLVPGLRLLRRFASSSAARSDRAFSSGSWSRSATSWSSTSRSKATSSHWTVTTIGAARDARVRQQELPCQILTARLASADHRSFRWRCTRSGERDGEPANFNGGWLDSAAVAARSPSARRAAARPSRADHDLRDLHDLRVSRGELRDECMLHVRESGVRRISEINASGQVQLLCAPLSRA